MRKSIYDPYMDQIQEALKTRGPLETYRLLFADVQDKIGGSYEAFYSLLIRRGIIERKPRYKITNQGLVDDSVAAQKAGVSYGVYKGMQYSKEHPLKRKVVPFKPKNREKGRK